MDWAAPSHMPRFNWRAPWLFAANQLIVRKDIVMSERMDDLAKSVAERTSRRSALAGIGALTLGALGIVGLDHAAEAADNPCQKCKKQCKRNNRRRGNKNPKDCKKKCRNKC